METKEEIDARYQARMAVVEEICDFIDQKLSPPLFNATSAAGALGKLIHRLEAMRDGADAAAEGD